MSTITLLPRLNMHNFKPNLHRQGIALWQWTRAPDDQSSGKQIAVDMDGTSTPFLHLSKLEVGVYKFVLKVTDTANQSSQAEVHVFVKPENNRPPLAITPADMKVVLPLDKSVVLDGSKSSDDTGVTKWLWEQIDGIYDEHLNERISTV
jgi:hypothetical protein